MSCFTRTTHNLRSGVMYQYNLNLGNPATLTTNTHYSSSGYSTGNHMWTQGIAEYERILAHIEKYAGKLNFCPSVNDLAATYNALNEELGLSGRVMDKAGFLKLADYKDSMLPQQPQGKSAIRRAKSLRSANHQLRGRGVDGGNILIDIKLIKQKIENEKSANDLRNSQIANLEKQKKQYEENLKLLTVEQDKIQIQNSEESKEIMLRKQLEYKSIINKNKSKIVFDDYLIPKVNVPDYVIPEITPTVVATSSLLPLGIIALLLYSRTGKK